MSRGRNSIETGALAAAFGFACGVSAALLLAKKPGRETRRDLADLLKKGKEKGEELVEQGREKLSPPAGDVAAQGGREPFYESGKYT